MSLVEMLQQLKRLTSKYQTPFGIAVWGFTAPGQAKEILVDEEGRLQVTGSVEVPNIDVLLSTRASESTLSSIKAQVDKFAFDEAGRLKTQLDSIPNPSNLDVALSTRASESTLSAVKSKTDNIDVPLSTRASELTLSGIKAQTDRLQFDASNRLAVQNPPHLDVALSTRASESTLLAIKSKTDNLDVALSTRASESTLSGVKAGTDYLDDIYGRLDVALSTRASETTLSSFVGTPDSSPPLKGVVLLGFDGTYVRRVKVTPDGRLLAVLG